ncbi:MAG: ATP-binding protein [Deltaproteobacteria bacterium]|nr:ATP-binding protein [Deltaproteobacteria bacterium]
MRIKDIHVTNALPVELFDVEDISDIVVIAGPNGVGKTRLVSALISHFQNLNGKNIKFKIQATSDDEIAAWGKRELDTSVQQDADLLTQMLQQNRQRRNLKSSVFYYESNRSIQKIQPLSYQWDMPDPWEEKISWNFTFGGLASRFQDTLHAIFKKIQTQKTSIANRAISLKQEGYESMKLEFSDPLDPFREAFFKLLGPKRLLKADVQGNTLRFEHKGKEYDINALSSGEREVLNIAFDFLLRSPSDCIVFVDEPELHLHPELSSKLISTLKSAGKNNQFILCSHSPDIISSSLEDTVIFLTPPGENSVNQAVVLKPDDQSTEALNRLGHSVGVVSLGKKIVLIEGTKASLDKQTYVHILKNRFPELVLLPGGGKGNLAAFDQVAEKVLTKTMWGIDFYMLADRDALGDSSTMPRSVGGRFRTLSKYHLENYFLDANILARVFQIMEPADSWLCKPDGIDIVLREIACEHIPYASVLIVANERRRAAGNVDVMLKRNVSMKMRHFHKEFSVAKDHYFPAPVY